MPEDKDNPPASGVTPPSSPAGSSTLAITNRLLDAAERDDDRKEREHKLIVETLERSLKLWQVTAMALITVLLVLVSGVVGVSVSGKLPGIGDIEIKQADEGAEPAPSEEQPEALPDAVPQDVPEEQPEPEAGPEGAPEEPGDAATHAGDGMTVPEGL